MNGILEVGRTLRAAREAKGWTLQDAAARLRLMARQVEAMETEDFAALGQPVFARGFVRNYARLLGLNADAVLERMAETGAAPPEPVEAASLPDVTENKFSPLLWMAVAVLLLLVAVPVGLYWWLNSGGDEGHANAEAPAAAQTPAVSNLNQAPLDASAQEQVSVPVASALAPSATQPASVETDPETEKTRANTPATAPQKRESAEAKEVTPVASVTEQGDGKKRIRLQFDEDAWVQVRDASGKTIHSAVGKTGSSVELGGQPPFTFVVGNAVNVRMTYEGRAFDIKPYIGEKVARFTLE